MPNTLTESTLRSTYKDDYHDSDNYHRILFNAGRALQARELTQLQTIIQSEITRFANNIYGKEGVAVVNGGMYVNDAHQYIKISNDQNNSFSDVSALKGQILTGSVSTIKVKVLEAIAAEGSDPDTIYVQYLDNPVTVADTTVQNTAPRVQANEILSNGSNVNLTVSNLSDAIGMGSKVEVGQSEFYVAGHFVYVPKQQVFLNKYATGESVDIGFLIKQDIITVSDTDALYDNQNATPNRSSPGADRLRIRLVLTTRDQVQVGDTFVFYGRVIDGVEYISTKTEPNSFEYVNKRIKEINGDFIKQYWKLRVRPDGDATTSDNFIMQVDPGVAYFDGKRIATQIPQQLVLPKATDTITRDDEQIGITYGNYYFFDSGDGMLDIDTCEKVNLYTGYNGSGNLVGSANVRAITEGDVRTLSGGQNYQRTPSYKLHLFNVGISNYTYSLADVLSVKSQGNADLVNLVPRTGNLGTLLVDQKDKALIFDTPLRRPKGFAQDATRPANITTMQKFNFTASGSTHEIGPLGSNQSFVNQADILIGHTGGQFMPSGVTTTISGTGNKKITVAGLTNGQSYQVIAQVKDTGAGIKTKALTPATVTGTLDSDGMGIIFMNLGKSDVYEIEAIKIGDSDGTSVFPYFHFDAGTETTHYDDSIILWSGGGLDSVNQSLFVRYKYFDPAVNGSFYAVNSYDGELEYLDVPAQSLPDGGKVSLRDVIDFRPSTDGSGNFTNVPPLPVPSDTLTADAEYYLPRQDKLVISKNSELRLIRGSSSLNPKFPEVPEDCMDLYNIRMEPNTLHTQDMKSTLIPRKGYTMQDINKLEEKIDKLQEMTSLSLLELNTKIMSVMDSAGNDRAKSGFFVDNFSNHAHTNTRSKEGAKSAIDKVAKMLRPRAPEEESALFYDSDVTGNLRVQLHGDFLMLEHTEVAYDAQEIASSTENLLPFHVPFTLGRMTISPETDTWKETQKVGESVVGRSTEFDLREALNWNNSNNAWFGVDPSSLDVGDTSKSFASATSTTVVQNTLDPVLLGTETREELGEWVKTGTVTKNETLSTTTVEVGRERQEETSRSTIDNRADLDLGRSPTNINFTGSIWAGANFGLGGGGGRTFRNLGMRTIPVNAVSRRFGEFQRTDNWDVVTRETRSNVRTTNTSTFETTKTITEENKFEQTTETTTTTNTTNTVNRVASESTIRDIVGKRIIDVSVIPFMRSVEIRFKAEGLRPNTQYFPFFDNTNVSQFCRQTSGSEPFKFSNRRRWLNTRLGGGVKDNHFIVKTSQQHNQGKTNLVSDAEGTVTGSFIVPNNASMRFHTGKREFMLIDVNTANEEGAMSFAKALFTSAGTLEKFENNVHVTRVLKIVGSTSQSVEQNTVADTTVWTDTVVTTEPATDVRSSSTTTVVRGNRETTRENESSDVEFIPRPRIVPPPPATPDVPPGATRANIQSGLDRARFFREQGMRGFNRPFGDPIAQTFQILEPGGCFITSIEVYFATKSADKPVFCEIRPTVNGVPASDTIIATKKLSASQVTTVPAGSTNKQMLSHSTKFTFDAPVFCPTGDYAVVLVPGDQSEDYNAYAAKVGEFQLGSQEARVTQQATLGAFFKSQNGKSWEAASGSDLTYKINVANFVSNGNAILQNANVDPEALSIDPLVVDSGSNRVRVMFSNHGLRTGDTTIIRGIDSATNFGNGLTGADVNGKRTVIDYDNSGYTYQADASANYRKWFGGQSVTSSQNLNFEVLRPSLDITQPSQTNVTLSMKTTSQQSLAGSQTRFVKEPKYAIIENEKNIYYNNPRAIYNRFTENQSTAGKLNGARSLEMQVTLKSTSPFLSPIVDLERAKVMTMHNLISKQDSATTSGFNVPLTYVSEEDPNFGTESAKHITKVTNLTEEAVGLKILLATNRPPEADFQVYWRCGGDGDNLDQFLWTLVEPENTLPPDTNKNVFREYRYLVGGENGALPAFTKFQAKIVMRSTNSAQVPTFRDLRMIALAV